MPESSSFAARCRRALRAFRAPSADPAAPPWLAPAAVDGLASVDLTRLMIALDARYLSTELVPDPYVMRVTGLAFAPAAGRLYVIYAGSYLFYSDDGLRSLHAVSEVNTVGPDPIPGPLQAIDAIVETVEGTLLLAGSDRRDGGEPLGVVWRKPRGAHGFQRRVITEPAWRTSPSVKLTAGFFGPTHARMIALSIYAPEDAHLYFSLDDGLTWRRQAMAEHFLLHVHDVYLPPSVEPSRVARLWVTGGDDPTGARSGVMCFESLDADGNLGGARWAFRESPGYRLVSLHGNGKHVFVGNESVAGGVIKIQDNLESIAARDFEYTLGKARHDYHQFNALLATRDGLLVAGTSSYRATGDTVRADSGGYLYVSADEGATYREVALGDTWVQAIADDGSVLWIAASSSRDNTPDVSRHRFQLLRLPRPSPGEPLAMPFVAKVVLLDSSRFYQVAGYADHPRPTLAPGERTLRVDLSAWGSIVVAAETFGPGTLAVEGLPFQNWRLEDHPWRDVATLVFEGAGRGEVALGDGARHNRWFRVRNAGPEPLQVSSLAFLGRR
jgi:hypothetical protein